MNASAPLADTLDWVEDIDSEGTIVPFGEITEESIARLRAYRYLGSRDTPVYVAIMRLFSSVLLAEWSAQEVADGLAAQGMSLDVDTVDARLRQLAAWGNLLPSPREVRVSSIAEYHRQAARYQLSKPGGRIQREVDAFLTAADGAREVSRELLGLVSRGLADLAVRAAARPIDGTDTAERVSTLFLQFGEFASSISDFYAYVGGVMSRFDLATEEFDGFKDLLLDYLESVVGEVALYTPAIEAALDELWPNLPAVLAVLDEQSADFRALQDAQPGGAADRARGRNAGDWEELRNWFSDGGSGSGAHQLRAAATRALGSLIANLKRINASSHRATSQRRDLLKLAGWFAAATPDEAHTVFDAAFGLHSARHLDVALEEDDETVTDRVPATTPWWKAPTAPVAVSLREHGDRAARGRSTKPADFTSQKQRLLEEHRRTADMRRAACDELAAASARLGEVKLSGPAMTILVELFASATVDAQLAGDRHPHFDHGHSSVSDTGLVLTVTTAPGARMRVRSANGDLDFYDLELSLRAAAGRNLAAEAGA